MSEAVTDEARQVSDLLGQLEAEAVAMRERIEAGGSLQYGTGAALLGDIEALGKIVGALDAIAKDPAA